jgi:tyrosyl-tRNA synthetase
MSVIVDPQKIEWFLQHAVENVYPTREWMREKLLSGQRLRVYLGVDPTGPSIHIGHAIAMQKLAELQALGHEVILLIGDFTAMIGDPTDKGATRKQLTREEVLENCRSYKQQASKILKFEGENPVQLRFNSEWLAKMSFADVLELAAHFTVQQMSERDMFAKRIEEEKPVYLHEFLYPLMQGYDSVAMEVDLEIGGNDQTFNMLAGRTLLKELKKKEKAVLTCKLLADPTGKKMGKSEGNMIALTDDPIDAYGKVMSWTDAMVMPGFEMLTTLSEEERNVRKQAMEAGENPMNYKRELAERTIAWCFGEEAAKQAAEHFSRVHQQHERPAEIPTYHAGKRTAAIADLLVETGLVDSKSEARRQIEQGGVSVNEQTIADVKAITEIPVEGLVLQKGKRAFIRVLP